MPFTTDGSVHHSGINNERDICLFLNTKSSSIRSAICPENSIVEHRGGTGSKADAEIVCPSPSDNKTVSIKHHKTGTFDWLNSSSAIPHTTKNPLNTGLQDIRNTYNKSSQKSTDIKNARTSTNDLLNKHLCTMTNETIKTVLSNCYNIYTDYVIIKNVTKKELVAFDRHKNIPELKTYEDWTYFLKSTPRAKTSAQIWRRNAEGQEVNTKLRIRLVLNNGVNALLGISTKNKSSVACIKIQQDDVAQFIASLIDPIKETY